MKKIFLSSFQLTEQRGLCSYSSEFSVSHCVIGVKNFKIVLFPQTVLSCRYVKNHRSLLLYLS